MSNSSKQIGSYLDAEMWERWEMASFDAPPPPAPAAAAKKPAPRLADLHAEIKRLRDTAQLRGHAEGYASGHTQGLQAGTEEGRKAGHEQGYQAGHAAGLEAGHAEGRERAAQEAAQLQSLAQACAAGIMSIETEMGQAMISLAIRIAEQVLRSTVDAHPEKILDLVRDITHLDTGKESVLKLRVNPADQDLVNHYMRHDSNASNWRLLADESIERGGCIAETIMGDIDATLQTRWQRVTATLGHSAPGPRKT